MEAQKENGLGSVVEGMMESEARREGDKDARRHRKSDGAGCAGRLGRRSGKPAWQTEATGGDYRPRIDACVCRAPNRCNPALTLGNDFANKFHDLAVPQSITNLRPEAHSDRRLKSLHLYIVLATLLLLVLDSFVYKN